jgi:hypothetical protein
LLRGVHVRGKAKPAQVEQPKRIPILPLNTLNDTLYTSLSCLPAFELNLLHCSVISSLIKSIDRGSADPNIQ